MTTDTRTPAEIAYDAERDGTLYVVAPAGQQAATLEDIHRAQVDAWNRMDEDEQLFATIVTGMMEKLPETHRAMGQAGMVLLTAACNQIGPEDGDDLEETFAARIHQVAYDQGFAAGEKAGFDGCIAYLKKRIAERSRDGS
jgi:hypothetical protein